MKYTIRMWGLQGQMKKIQKAPGRNVRVAHIPAWRFLYLPFNF